MSAALYLHLRALGLELALLDRPEHSDGTDCAIKVTGLKKLGAGGEDRTRQLILANKPALIALLRSGSPAALAVRQEGSYLSNKPSRKEAA